LLKRYATLLGQENSAREAAELAERLGFTADDVQQHQAALADRARIAELEKSLADTKAEQRKFLEHFESEWSTAKHGIGVLIYEAHQHRQRDLQERWGYEGKVSVIEKNISDAKARLTPFAFLFEPAGGAK